MIKWIKNLWKEDKFFLILGCATVILFLIGTILAIAKWSHSEKDNSIERYVIFDLPNGEVVKDFVLGGDIRYNDKTVEITIDDKIYVVPIENVSVIKSGEIK
jgi:hypothetical protein